MKEVIYYEKENGAIPMKIFLTKMAHEQPGLLSKVYGKIKLSSFDLLGAGDVKYIKNGIFELRIRYGNNIGRMFYFHHQDNVVLLLDGFLKKDNKLKGSIIKRVEEYKYDYIKRAGKI
ncbi:type II toxin-antitoxin system RelE/ParE family toxin [Candidatus Gracilibacteria bacterium 28_42_T64]|nr:type II toxin-antitoxin system RelE/ParE family toxin [Candidatus Gracilibacteria bacterium 28_42_T64]